MALIQHLIEATSRLNLQNTAKPSELTDDEIDKLLGEYIAKLEAGKLVGPAESASA